MIKIKLWNAKQIKELDRMIDNGISFCDICSKLDDKHPKDVRMMIDTIKCYGVKKSIEMEMYDYNDRNKESEFKHRDTTNRKIISKMAARARSLGMSYGKYAISDQYKLDVCDGMYELGVVI